jgi:hypothetical protein
MLHTFSDGSVLYKIKAHELISIPVWKGNRFINLDHANQIKKEIGDAIQTLDSSIFRVVKYKDGKIEQKFLADGQHRQYVMRKYYEENVLFALNFDVILIEKTVDSEADAIEYFNTLNNSKPQQDNDPKLLANKYILAMIKQFKIHIRPEGKTTKRPFLSSDALRKVLEENATLLKQSNDSVKLFIEKVDSWNKKKINEYELRSAFIQTKEQSVLSNCIDKKFVLAFDVKLPWVKECLT